MGNNYPFGVKNALLYGSDLEDEVYMEQPLALYRLRGEYTVQAQEGYIWS